MSTRWMRENPDELITMHAHNMWSVWYSAMLEAANKLGIPVKKQVYRNWDNSWSERYYVPKNCGWRIRLVAEPIHQYLMRHEVEWID